MTAEPIRAEMSLADERAQAAADALPPLTDDQRRRLRALLNIDERVRRLESG